MATYTVKQGDTLSALAKQYNTSVDEIAKTNTIQNPNFITVGQNLQLPTVTGDANIPPNIPSGATGEAPRIEAVPPPPLTSTPERLAGGVLAAQAAQQEQAQRDADIIKQSYEQTAPIEQQNNTIVDRVTSLFEKLGGKTARAQELSQQSGIPVIQKNIDDLNVQIAQRAAQFEKEIAGLSGRGEGQTNAVVSAETDRARRIQAVELAGLQAIKSSYEGNYNRAKAQIDEAIKAEFEPVEAQINAALFNLERNDKNLTVAEQRRAEQTAAELNQRKQEVEAAKQEKRDIFDLVTSAVKAGADPATVEAMNKAGSKEEALNIGTKVLGNEFKIQQEQRLFENKLATEKFDFDKKITLAKLNLEQAQEARLTQQAQQDLSSGVLNEAELKAVDASPQGKILLSLNNLLSKVIRYKSLVDQYGFQKTGKEKTELDGAYSALQIAWKEAANLGALTGPDLALIENAVKPVTGLAGIRTKYAGGGLEGVQNGLQSMINTIKTDAATAAVQLNTRNEKYENSEYVKGLTAPFAQVTTTNNAGRTVIGKDGEKYKVGVDGQTLIKIK